MNVPQLKRMLWVMNEIKDATEVGGITREQLNEKWVKSCQNDYDGKPIAVRTFYRLIPDLESLFECEIECSPSSKKYYISLDESSPKDQNETLLEILQKKTCGSSINQILHMLTVGNDIPADDMRSARDLAAALSKLPQVYAGKFLETARNIRGVDSVEEDEYYKRNYVCVWNDATYNRTLQWLSIGFYDNEVYFYLVSNDTDPSERERKAAEAGFGEGIRYRGGYYWHKPLDPELFSMSFDTKPNMEEVVRRAELLASQLEKVNPTEKKVMD